MTKDTHQIYRLYTEQRGNEDEPHEITDGIRQWHNEDGLAHRDGDKPAVIHPNGTALWFQNGNLHRDGDKPAIMRADGLRAWYQNGGRHREGDKPALISPDGTMWWCVNNSPHRETGPAYIAGDGTMRWFYKGKALKPERWALRVLKGQNKPRTDKDIAEFLKDIYSKIVAGFL